MDLITGAFVSPLLERIGTVIGEEVVLLLGVKDDLKKLENKLEMIRDVLEDAENKKLNNRSIQRWLDSLREVMYDADDIVDECRSESKNQRRSSLASPINKNEVGCSYSLFFCFSGIKYRHEIARKIKSINERLSEISKSKSELQLTPTIQDVDGFGRAARSRQTSWVIVDTDIVALEEDAEHLVTWLTEGNKERITVSAITGMGGIGKTTLAQKVFNDTRIELQFDAKMWVCVSENYTEVELLRKIIRAAGGSCSDCESRAELDTKITRLLEQKRFMLVLDDVWSELVWESLLRAPLQRGAMGSRVLVTTRNKGVARGMGAADIHQMKSLRVEDGWSMLSKKVFADREGKEIPELRDVGKMIVEKCKGLPLAIKVVGGVLLRKERREREWKKILDSHVWSTNLLPNEILPALYLSYDDLPSHLKQCFAYCSLFPKDYKFDGDFLIRAWIAEGFIGSKGEWVMEDVAEGYFEELVSRSLLQLVSDDDSEKNIYKMHDLLHDLTLFVVRHGHLCGDLQALDTVSVQPRRLSLIDKGLAEVPSAIEKLECLRTLLLLGNEDLESVPIGLFNKLQRLRVLDFSSTRIEKLPNTLGKLIHLRCLCLGNTRLRELPESLWDLQNLQTLDLSNCRYLRRLPKGLKRLRNLRHLFIDGSKVEHIPSGIGELVCLQTLVSFVVESRDGFGGDTCGCEMKELKELVHLRRLSIMMLERVASRVEVKEADLGNKANLHFLRLGYFPNMDHVKFELTESVIRTSEEVLEELAPPPSLETLLIYHFPGTKLPSWISKPSLSNLDTLFIGEAYLVEQLPPFGRLPNLRRLSILGTGVKAIGPEFFGGAGAFPKLQKLEFSGMVDLEKWEGLDKGVMPCLTEIKIGFCSKLRSLPEGLQHLAALQRLEIVFCMCLREIKNLTSLTYLGILSCPNLEVILNLPTLVKLYIFDCPRLKDLEGLVMVKGVGIFNFGGLMPEGLCHMTTLKSLFLHVNDDLLNRWMVDGQEWPKIKHLSKVVIMSSRRMITHTNSPDGLVTTFDGDEEDSEGRALEKLRYDLRQANNVLSLSSDHWKNWRSKSAQTSTDQTNM